MNTFEKEVYERLKEHYKLPEWIVLPQVNVHTGAIDVYGGARFIDFFVLNAYPSKNYSCLAIEAKRTIQDFRNDVKQPLKQLAAKFYSDRFYYIMPEEMFEKHRTEIIQIRIQDKGTGILVLQENGYIKEMIRSAQREKSPFPMGFICSLLRNAVTQNADRAI